MPGSAIEQLLVTEDWLTGVHAAANTTVREREDRFRHVLAVRDAIRTRP